MALITLDDLDPFVDIDEEKAIEMIADATALAVLAAPALGDEDDLTANQLAAAKAILRGAILRWNDAGDGALQQRTAGPFTETIDTRVRRSGMFTSSEIDDLRAIVTGTGGGGSFAIDTAPCTSVIHADICSLRFGATYCSCGAVLTGMFPLYECS